jgi:hypothetical protein
LCTFSVIFPQHFRFVPHGPHAFQAIEANF